jgi:hypothetical protein
VMADACQRPSRWGEERGGGYRGRRVALAADVANGGDGVSAGPTELTAGRERRGAVSTQRRARGRHSGAPGAKLFQGRLV